MAYGQFWTWGLPRVAVGFDGDEVAVMTAVARGGSTAEAVAAQAGVAPELAREAMARLIGDGAVRRDGDTLSLAFPLFDERDDRALLPTVGEIAGELFAAVLGPRTQDVATILGEAGYGHLREQFLEWRLWSAGDVMGESLRELMLRGVLPAAPHPMKVSFGLMGWLGDLQLLSWTG